MNCTLHVEYCLRIVILDIKMGQCTMPLALGGTGLLLDSRLDIR